MMNFLKKIVASGLTLIIALSLTFLFKGCNSQNTNTQSNIQTRRQTQNNIKQNIRQKQINKTNSTIKTNNFEITNQTNKKNNQIEISTDYINIELNDKALKELGYQDKEKIISLKIPSIYKYGNKKYKIIGIKENLFKDCKYLSKLTIPESVIKIGDNAFENCKYLESVKIAEGVKEIGNYSFYNCISLENINIPKSLKEIGNNCFDNCISLKYLSIPDNVVIIGDNAFKGIRKIRYLGIATGSPWGAEYINNDVQSDKIETKSNYQPNTNVIPQNTQINNQNKTVKKQPKRKIEQPQMSFWEKFGLKYWSFLDWLLAISAICVLLILIISLIKAICDKIHDGRYKYINNYNNSGGTRIIFK